MSKRIALLGLSGVGKSTLIMKLKRSVKLSHLQASTLIKAEQAYRMTSVDSSDALRIGAVIGNQALMISSFRRELENTTLPIIFDGHSIIDGRDGLVEIPASVFAELYLDAICFLVADPQAIVARRQGDVGRLRPDRDAETLAVHQGIAQAGAERIARAIGCSFMVISGEDPDSLIGLRQLLVLGE